MCLLFSFLHPEHERRVGEALREALPGTRVSLSVELLPEFREYERCSTTVANAYLAPALSAYLAEIEPPPLVMQSSGGVVDAATAAERAQQRASSPARRRASPARRSSRISPGRATCSRSTWAARAPTSRPFSAAARR